MNGAGTMKLLIVDDSQEMRRLIKRILVDLAEEIFECENGAEAVVAYEQYNPDVVLMDIEMPVMDGLSATRKIIVAHPDARIIIVTRFDHEKMRTAAITAGASDFVGKENLQALRACLNPDR